MTIHAGQLREYIIRPVLRDLGLYSEAAEELLMLTAATESLCGKYLHQVGGPALGIYQCEPFTHNDIWASWLAYQKPLADKVRVFGHKASQLPGNLYYATAIARIHYFRRPEPLPSAMDERGLAQYWKDHYNTHLGAGTVEKAIENYRKYGVVS